MAKKTLMSDIASDVREIKESKSKFGTKLPSNGNKEKEMTLKELSYEQMIMGSIASLTWGVRNIDKDTQIKTLLGKANIFDLIKGIKSSIDSQAKVLKQLKEYSETSKEILQGINDNLSQQIVDSTWALIKSIKENSVKLGEKLNTEKFNTFNKSLEELIDKLSKNLAKNFGIFTNEILLPKFNDLIKEIEKLNKCKESIKDSTTNILIDFKSTDTIEQLIKKIDKLDKLKLIDNDSVNNIKEILENIKSLQETKIEIVDFKPIKVIEDIIKEFDALDNVVIFDNDNVNRVQDLLTKLDELSKEDIYLVINTNLYDTVQELKELKIDIYDPKCLDNIKAEIEKLKGEKINLFSEDNLLDVYELIDEANKAKVDLIDIANIDNIKTLIDNLQDVNISLFNDINIDNVKAIIDEVKSQEKINIFDIDSLKDVQQLLENISSLKGDDIANTIIGNIENLMKEAASFKIEDVEKNKKNILNLTKFIGDNTGDATKEGSIKHLLATIQSLSEGLDSTKFKTLRDAFEIINSASKLMEGHDTKINKRFFKDLNSVLIGDDYIKGTIKKLADLKDVVISKDVKENVKIVDSFVLAVSNLGTLGIIKLIKAKIAIKAINAFLVKDIGSLIEQVSKFKTSTKDTDKSFEALDHLFDAITKLGEISISNKRKMVKNLVFIENFLTKDIRKIIEESIPSLKKSQKDGFEVLEKTKGIIDSLISIGDIDEKKLDIASDKIDDIKDFIKDDINELLKFISENLGPKKELKKIIEVTDLTREIFENIESMNDSIPSIMSLIKANAKVLLLTIEFAFIEESFKTISRLTNILKSKDKKFLSTRFDGTLQSIIDINSTLSLINTKQGIKDILALDEELAYMYWCMDFIKEIAESYTKILKFNEFKKTIQNIKTAVDSINVTKEDYKKLDSLTALLNVMYTLGQYASDKTKFDVKKFNEATDAIINGAVPFIEEFRKDSDLAENLKELIAVNDKTLEKFDQIIKLIEKFDKLSKIAVLSKLSNIGLKGIAQEAEYIKVIIGKFADIDNKEIKKADKSLKLFQKLVIMSAAILIFGALVMKFIKIADLLLFTGTLAVFLFAMTGVFKLVSKSLKDSMDGAKGAVLLIGASAFVLLIGSMMMNYIDVGNLILFIGTLTIFLFSIGLVFRLFSKGFKDSLEGAREAMIIVGASALIMIIGSKLISPKDFFAAILFAIELGVFLFSIGLAFRVFSEAFDIKQIVGIAEDMCLIIAVSGGILILGALVSAAVGIEHLILFTLELALLIGGTIAVYTIASKFAGEAMKSARDIAILIGVSGLVLILAGLLANHIKMGWLLLFELELMVLIGGVLAIYVFAGKFFQQAIKGASELAILVLASGFILILAGLVVKYIDLGSLFLFTLILGAFIAGILLVYSIASKGFKKAFKGAAEMVLLIAASALILILGSIAVEKWVDIPSLILFTVLLAGFIFAITFTYSLFGKKIRNAIAPAIGLAILTAISGLVLIMGGKYFLDNPGLATAVLEFAALLVGYIAVMGGVCFLLGKFMAKIAMGLAVMALLMGLTYLSTLVIEKIRDVASQEGFLLNILKGVGAIALVIAAIGGIAFAAGALVMGPQALVFAAGVAVMATISGLALLAAEAVKNIAVAMMYMKAVEKFDPGIMIDNIKGFIAIAKEMEPIAESFSMIMKASIAIQMMSSALSSVAKTLKDWAELKIPVYEGTEVVRYETITGDMFPKAAENIKAVVTTLAQAIIDVYNAAPEMFDGPLLGLFDTPFIKVTKGIQKMGPALSSVAEAVKDWADLKIPVYEGTKKTGYKTIVSEDFVTAGKNIQQVVTCLGQAIIDTYNNAPQGMFDGPLFGLMDTPFVKVTEGIKKMGPALSSVADAVKDWADLKIPVYTGDKITGYQTITSGDFVTAAGHIKEVVKTLGLAIIETYDECEKNEKTKGMFDPQGFLGLGKSKFALVTKAFKTMGPMLSSIADGISKWAELKIPVYKGTEIVEYKTLKDNEFDKAADNIKKVLKCIGEALVEVVEKNPKIFGDNLLTDSPAITAANAMKIMGETLNLTATAVASYASGIFPLFDKDGKYIKDIIVKDKDYTKAADNIKKVLVCIGNALKDVVDNSDIFKGDLFSDAPAIKAAEAIKGMSEALNNSVTAIAKLSELNMDDMYNALNPNGEPDNVYHRINDLLNFTVDIYRLFVSQDSSLATTGTVSHWYGDEKNVKMSFAEYLDEHNGDIEDANEALETFTSLLSKMLDNYIEIAKVITDNEEALKIFVGGTNSEIYKYMSGSVTSVASMIRLLIAEDNLDLFDDIEDEEDDILDGIKSTTNICKSLLENLTSLENLYNELNHPSLNIFGFVNKFIPSMNSVINSFVNKNVLKSFEDLDDEKKDIIAGINNTYNVCDVFLRRLQQLRDLYKSVIDINLDEMIPMINSFNNVTKALSKIGKGEEENQLTFILPSLNATMLAGEIAMYNSALELIIKTNERAKEAGEEGYNILRDGILKVYSATSQIVDNRIFKEHVADLENYIETINSIKLNNLTKLKDFVDSMNELSKRLGNLDKLTDAVGNKLSAVLYDLVVQLRLAEATIKNAHALQEKRKKLMEQSMQKIERIMDKHMIVEISQQSEDDTSSTPNGSINGNPIEDGNPVGTDTTPATTTPRADNPENTTTANGVNTHTTKKQQGDSGMSYGQFINYMESVYLNKLGKKVEEVTRG